MFKKIAIFTLIILLSLPNISLASVKSYNTKNFEEALTEENIEHDLGGYTESDNKINIYLFRGVECPYCNKFMKFLYNNIAEYGKYFNLVTFEVYNDKDNSDLLKEVSTYLNGSATSSIPYIIIGENVFIGFDETTDGDKILSSIKKLYESKDRYDVFDKMYEKEETTIDFTPIIVWNLAFIIFATSIIIYLNYKNNKNLNLRIDKIEKLLLKKK